MSRGGLPQVRLTACRAPTEGWSGRALLTSRARLNGSNARPGHELPRTGIQQRTRQPNVIDGHRSSAESVSPGVANAGRHSRPYSITLKVLGQRVLSIHVRWRSRLCAGRRNESGVNVEVDVLVDRSRPAIAEDHVHTADML